MPNKRINPFEGKRMTENRVDYLEELSRVHRLEEIEGKTLDIQIPERVTKKDIKKLKDITRAHIRKEGRELPTQREIVLDNVGEEVDVFNLRVVKEYVNTMEPEATDTYRRQRQISNINFVRDFLNDAIATQGELVVAQRLENQSAAKLIDIIQGAVYPSDEPNDIRPSQNEFISILYSGPISQEKAAEMEEARERAFYGE